MRGFHKTEINIFCPPPPFLGVKNGAKLRKNEKMVFCKIMIIKGLVNGRKMG